VQVRQYNGIELGEIGDGKRGIGDSFRGQTVTQVRPLAPVQEIRVGQESQRTEPDQRGRVADERQ